jgi:CPA1 family monovalent cation:H+ antiporter
MPTFEDTIVLLVLAIGVAMVAHKLRFPYSIGLVIFGILIGLAGTLIPELRVLSGRTGLLSPDTFFGILLPPLIYEAAIHVDYSLLKSRIWLILAFAFLGVVVSTILTGFLVMTLTVIPFVFALLLGAVLSPTDPVAVLDLSKRLNIPRQLSTIIESESLLNDAVGIVVFAAVLQLIQENRFAAYPIISSFSFLVLGGLVIGLMFSAIAYLPHRFINDPSIETVFSIVIAYGSFHSAEALGASGIVSTVVVGMATGTWIIPRTMDEEVRSTLFSFWKVIAYVSNSIIFLSMGLLVNLSNVVQNLLIIIAVFAFVTLARTAFIFSHYLLSRVSRISKLPFSWYNMLTLSGVRGAIPIVLVLTLSSATAPIPESISSLMISVVIGVATLSVTLQNFVAGHYVKRIFGASETGAK